MFLHHLFRLVLETAISTFNLELWYGYLKSTRRRDNATLRDEKSPRTGNGELIRAFIDLAAAYSEDAASHILWKISMQASKITTDAVSGILLPLIKALLPSADTRSLEVQYWLQLFVKAYITQSVSKEPSKPVNWARRGEMHECSREGCACSQVNAFLEDPNAKEQTIDLGPDSDHVLAWFQEFVEVDYLGAGKIHFTKTLKHWVKRHGIWEREVESAQRNLRDLPQDELKQALGTQYGTLMALDLVRVDGTTAAQSSVGKPSNNTNLDAPKRPQNGDPDHAGRDVQKRARRGTGGTLGQRRSERLRLNEGQENEG
ncbi:hypothetical protein F5883DRAFT_30499 [Diaporthe sp. PMI_573]|nr:hypothetical protein F5883DRAFT_30499 [Diaporthaceae sp. PMI_573]